MGKGTYANLGFNATVKDKAKVYIGKNVSIAPNVTIICDSCANNGREINTFKQVQTRYTKHRKVVIEDEVWIGAGVIILPGVHIGRCSIIGAGSIVTKDIEPYSVYKGNPAIKYKIIDK